MYKVSRHISPRRKNKLPGRTKRVERWERKMEEKTRDNVKVRMESKQVE